MSHPTPPTHGGNLDALAALVGRDPADLIDFSANIHPWGPPPEVRRAALGALERLERYPAPYAAPLTAALSDRLGAPVSVGNGATELLCALVRGARRLVLRAPCYLGYAEAAALAGVPVIYNQEPEPGDVVLVGRPNNPDGHLPTPEEVAALARPGVRVVVDESFLGFTEAPSCLGLPGVAVVCSLTKTYGIPGLRLGWCSPPVPLPPWTVNTVAQAAGLALLDRWGWPRELPLDAWRRAQAAALAAMPGVADVRGAANFLLIALRAPEGPARVAHALHQHGVLIRDASNFVGLDAHHLRVAVRTPDALPRLLAALA